MYVYIYIHTYIYACIYIYTYLSNLSIYLSNYLPIYLSTYLPIYLSTYLPIYLSTYLPIYLSIFKKGLWVLKSSRSFVLWTNVHIEGKGEAQCMVLVTQLRNSEIGHSLSVVIPVVDGVTSRGCQRVQRVLNCFLESRYLRQLLGEEADAWFGRKLNSKEGTKVPGILGHPQQKRLRLQDTNSTFSSPHGMLCWFASARRFFLQNSMDFHGFSFIFILWQSGNQTWLENPPRSSMIFPVYIYICIYIYIIFIDSIDARW